MPEIRVEAEGGYKFRARVGKHSIPFDLPRSMGGEDTAPLPTEHLVATLGACIGVFALRYLRQHRLPEKGFSVALTWERPDDPPRVSKIEARIILPSGFPEEHRSGLLACASRCTIHNTLQRPPEVKVHIA